jgi:adenosylhomocysteine nucleosidase
MPIPTVSYTQTDPDLGGPVIPRARAVTQAVVLVLLLTVAARSGALPSASRTGPAGEVVVVVSADTEWKVVRALHPGAPVSTTPYGEWFSLDVKVGGRARPVILFHGGWGKIAAAGSTQYAVQRWKPQLLVNLGTCGGFRGAIEKDEVLLVEKTVVYDIVEQMGDAAESIAWYATAIDLGWVGSSLPPGVRRGPLVSADRDLLPADIPRLRATYGAVAGDWESGAIAWVARANGVPLLILRGVTDLVGAEGGEAYGNLPVFEEGARRIMTRLLADLPWWLERWESRRAPAGADD